MAMDINSQDVPPLELKSVQDLLSNKYAFNVPGYQRGYRWTAEDVKVLIDDLILFQKEENAKAANSRCPFYSLQVLVIKETEDNRYEVIDGQQRLTTVLILLQALFCKKMEQMLPLLIQLGKSDQLIDNDAYEIQYETREDSHLWLSKITAAFFQDLKNKTTAETDKLRRANPDYSHFVDAFKTAIEYFKNFTEVELNDFTKTLKKDTKFIWYNTSKSASQIADTDVDIFNRLNATKINLNNAELIKALLLQDGNFLNIPINEAFSAETSVTGDIDLLYERDQIAIDWDNLEKQLQDPNLWQFAYSSRHPYRYETHIEYLFDLIAGKSADDKDSYYFTFKYYYDKYTECKINRIKFVRDTWREVQEMFLLLQEWFLDKCCYHYIGYLLEYGKTEDGSFMTIPYLKHKLYGKDKDEREGILKRMIRNTLKGITGDHLVYKNNYILNQVLLLFNIELEQRRQNETSRFSFAEYKSIRDDIGWDLEHVASNIDYEPKWEKRKQLASDLLEYFTGVKYEENTENITVSIRRHFPKNNKAKSLCESLLLFFEETIGSESMNKTYDSIMNYFEAEDKFKEITIDKSILREKDFIWNFVLLNGNTNKSYGNNIFPVKRRRIQDDDNCIYTPIGTRAVFEKAYSKKLTNLISWGRNDAIEYWKMISYTLREFMPTLELPKYINID